MSFRICLQSLRRTGLGSHVEKDCTAYIARVCLFHRTLKRNDAPG